MLELYNLYFVLDSHLV